MKTLVTGGAGFIGSHVVPRLLEMGREIVVLDSLEEQVHGGREPDLPDDVRFIHGDVGDPQAAARALEGVDEVVHLAAVVGVGQSMYEIDRYTRSNTMATATFLEQVVARKIPPSRLVVASSMSIYGEGEYECETHGRVAPGPRPEEQLLARQWEVPCPQCGEELRPVGTGEDEAGDPDLDLRDHQARPRGAVPGDRRVLRDPHGGAALLQRLRSWTGAVQPIHRGGRDLRLAADEREPPLIFEDGQQSRDFIHVSDIVTGIVRALSSQEAEGKAINLGTGRPTNVTQIAEVLADGLGVAIDPEWPKKYRSGDIRHCYADPSLARRALGFEASVSLPAGMENLLEWLEGQEAVDRVDSATRELAARGLTR